MEASPERVAIPGSERGPAPAGHRRAGDADLSAPIRVTVYLRPLQAPDWVDSEAARPPAERRRVGWEQWAAEHGAAAGDIEALRQHAQSFGLTVESVDSARRAVTLSGALGDVAAAFGAQLEGEFDLGAGTRYRARSGALTVPRSLDGIVTGVFGIDNRPQAQTRLRRPRAPEAAVAFTPPQVAAAYAFPTGVDGAGETVGILELGGGFSTTDLKTYFTGLGLAAPVVSAVGVDGGTNSPGTDPNADGEVMLDIEVVGAVAPGARIAVYFAPNTDQGFIDALSTAVHDASLKPSAVSISWGQSEDAWSAQARAQMEQIMVEAGGLGVTVTVAAGDNGSADGVSDGRQHVDFPASAPHALACGGTSLHVAAAAITSETVWNDPGEGATGGGVSDAFPLPSYQSSARVPDNADTGTPGRGVPDVCGDADPQTGYTIRVDGADETIGGTSAVAPLWAGLTALLNQRIGAPLGFAQPRLYTLLGTAAFHDITAGNNGAYSAGPGWDCCTGLGSPNGAALASALAGAGAPPAGR
ncbi:MAG: S53 family peptidase [Solirubrobacteraceae bacterium]